MNVYPLYLLAEVRLVSSCRWVNDMMTDQGAGKGVWYGMVAEGTRLDAA